MGTFHFDSKYGNGTWSTCAMNFGNFAWSASNRQFSSTLPLDFEIFFGRLGGREFPLVTFAY